MDSKNSGRRRNFLSSQTTKLSKLSLNKKKTKDTEKTDQEILPPSLFDSPFLSKSCRYIDIGSAESRCSTETSKAKSLHSTFPSGSCVTETPEANQPEDGPVTGERIETSEVLGKENVTRSVVCDDSSENLLSTNSAISKSEAVAGVSKQNQTPSPARKSKSEVSPIFESVTFDNPDFELNLCDLGQQHDKSDGEPEPKKEEVAAAASETAVAVDDFNLNPADINISACPLCWKKFEKKTTLFSHMKSCASSHNVSTRQLLNALDLQNKQAAERKAIGLPAGPLRAPARKSSSTRKSSYNVKDPNLALALALSESMKEAEVLEIQKETDVLLEAGLEDEAMEKQKSLLERFGFTSSKSPVLESVGAKYQSGSKKFRGIDPLLQTRSQEERERLITEKVAIILMDEDCSSSSQKQNTSSAVFKLSSKLLKKLQDVEKTHWQISYASEEVERSEYYVKSLQNIIPVCSIESGSKLKQLTEIPCREKTPEKGEQTSKCYYDSTVCYENSSEEQLFKFVDEKKYPELRESEKFEPAPSADNLRGADKLSPVSSLLESGADSFRKECLADWESMVNNEAMSDVTIYTKNGVKICAHRLVFYARCSKILADVTQNAETGGGIIFWSCVTYNVAIAFLTYLYCGDVKTIGDHLGGVKYLAERYNVTGLLNIFKTGSYDCGTDTVQQSSDEQKQSVKEMVTASISSSLAPPTETGSECNLETPLTEDWCGDSSAAPRSPDLFEDQKMLDTDSDDLNCSRYSSNSAAPAAGGKSDLDFLASMLCKPTPAIASPPETGKTETDHFDVSVSQVVSKDLASCCETDELNLSCTPGREARSHAKRYFEDDDSGNEYANDVKKMCIGGELGVSSDRNIEARSCDDLVDLTQTSSDSDENEEGKCSGRDNEGTTTTTKKVTSPEFSWKGRGDEYEDGKSSGGDNKSTTTTTKQVTSPEFSWKGKGDKYEDGKSSSGDNKSTTTTTKQVTSPEFSWKGRGDEYEDGNTSGGDNKSTTTTTKQVTSPEFSWKGGGEGDEVEGGSPDKIVIGKEELSGNELAVGTNYDSPDKTGDPTSPANVSYPEFDLYGYDEYDHLYSNDELSDRSPVKSPENPGQGTARNESEESQASDTGSDCEIKMVSLSQKVTVADEGVNNSSPSLNKRPAGQTFKSPCVPSAAKQSQSPNLLALLDDSFAENLANSSLLRQSTSYSSFNSPGIGNGSEKAAEEKRLGAPEDGEHQNNGTPDNGKLNNSPNVTPMPDYSAMKTPVLKKELNKYGLKDLKRRQAKLILRHIYNELHPLVPIENVAGKLDKKSGENQNQGVRLGSISAAAPRSPVKRNLLTNMGAAGGMETEPSALSDSESSESSSSENDVGDDKIFAAEADEVLSQEEGPVAYDLSRVCQEFIQNNPELHQKILLYEPIWLDEMYSNLKCLVPKLKLNALMDYLDEQCITFRTSSQRQRRTRRRMSPSKKKRVATKVGRTAKSKKNAANLNDGCS